ncbi:MAG: site-specific DNA-methyltransferase [Alphaproteobacteria bacterium]|nr:site-specific DNA-methyltransferase [Alphaproteobacteria bacterium]
MTELNFKGKEFVYNHHLAVPFRPLVPDETKGIGPVALDDNLIVHGDNLHALKALLPLYAGKVDCIFIDPPYNTGNEGWAYNDNVNAPMIREWLESNPIGIEDGLRHDKWCAMMWPRMRLLHELLAESGSIWITLDDNEVHRAKLMLDEIFGIECFVANAIWQKKYAPQNDAKWFSNDHDHILIYAKSGEDWSPNQLQRTDIANARYRNPDDDPRGPWKPGDALRNEYREYAFYELETPAGNKFWPPEGTSWRFNKEEFPALVKEGRLWFGADGQGRPAIKRFLKDVKQGITPQTLWFHDEVGHNQEAARELQALGFGGQFATPKPRRLVDRAIEIGMPGDGIILDSFAGSGTTAHAVLEANNRDGGNRRFILVEMEDYADLLTAERVRRVINGYAFTGTQRTELLRDKITWTKLKNADKLTKAIAAIETLHGHEYDAIKKTVKDGELIVTGEKAVKERTEGLGGSFTYCTLGDPVELDKVLSGETLPPYDGLGSVLFHMATARAFDPAIMREDDFYLGAVEGQHVWLIYKPDLDWLKSPDAALTLKRAKSFAETDPDARHLVFAPARYVSQKMLAEQNIPVEFVPLPFALYRIDRS